jgi:predicted alpha/beta hydrolase family esterase
VGVCASKTVIAPSLPAPPIEAKSTGVDYKGRMRANILHGTMGRPDGNWFTWLASALEALGIETIVPSLPTPEGQSLESWRSAFRDQCGSLDSGTVLIGHSCGGVLALRLLEQLEEPIAATVLVAPPIREIGIAKFDELNSTFLDGPFDYAKIKANAGEIVYLMADNDPYVPQDQLRELASSLGVVPNVIEDGGHLNAASGYTTFPALLTLLTGCLASKAL